LFTVEKNDGPQVPAVNLGGGAVYGQATGRNPNKEGQRNVRATPIGIVVAASLTPLGFLILAFIAFILSGEVRDKAREELVVLYLQLTSLSYLIIWICFL